MALMPNVYNPNMAAILNSELSIFRKFIHIPSYVKHPTGNIEAINFITSHLESIGFKIQIRGDELSEQPTIVAKYLGHKSNRKVVIYGHYDVALVKDSKNWVSDDPFTLEEVEGRVYGRGVADNKGPLLSRIQAITELIKSDKPVPQILWLIQGEEEIIEGERVAHKVFKNEIPSFGANLYIEETGFNDLVTNEQIAFLWSRSVPEKQLYKWHSLLNNSLNQPRIEFRHLNKLNGIEACPLLSNLPQNSIYIGFGPNDKLHNIHQDNESLAKSKLLQHKNQFKKFITLFAEATDVE